MEQNQGHRNETDRRFSEGRRCGVMGEEVRQRSHMQVFSNYASLYFRLLKLFPCFPPPLIAPLHPVATQTIRWQGPAVGLEPGGVKL